MLRQCQFNKAHNSQCLTYFVKFNVIKYTVITVKMCIVSITSFQIPFCDDFTGNHHSNAVLKLEGNSRSNLQPSTWKKKMFEPSLQTKPRTEWVINVDYQSKTINFWLYLITFKASFIFKTAVPSVKVCSSL